MAKSMVKKSQTVYLFWQQRFSVNVWIARASAIHNNQKQMFTEYFEGNCR